MRNLRALNLANEQITVADSALFDLPAITAMSVLVWFKLSGSVPTTTILNKTEGGLVGFNIAVNASDKLVSVLYDDEQNEGTPVSVASVAADVWNLAVLTINGGGDAYVYLNGVASTVVEGIAAGINNAANIVIADSAFSGQLGEVQIVMGHALTAAQVLDLYNRGTKGFKASYGAGDVRLWLRWINNIFKDNSGYDNVVTGSNVDRTDRVRISKYR